MYVCLFFFFIAILFFPNRIQLNSLYVCCVLILVAANKVRMHAIKSNKKIVVFFSFELDEQLLLVKTTEYESFLIIFSRPKVCVCVECQQRTQIYNNKKNKK